MQKVKIMGRRSYKKEPTENNRSLSRERYSSCSEDNLDLIPTNLSYENESASQDQFKDSVDVRDCDEKNGGPMKKNEFSKEKQKDSEHIIIWLLFLGLIGLLFVILFSCYQWMIIDNYKDTITKLKQDFPSQSKDFWSVINSGLENVINKSGKFKSTVFLFLNPRDGGDTLQRLIGKIAKIAATGLGSEDPLILFEEDINRFAKDRGHFMEYYRTRLEKYKVLVVPDLHKIPAHIAESLHFFCDADKPMVEKSVIMLRMNISDNVQKGRILRYVEDTLHKLWSPPLKDNIIEPVIARLTTNVIEIAPDIVYYGKSQHAD